MTKVEHTPGTWKFSKVQKKSNFGNYTAYVTGYVDDPARNDGSKCSTTIAKVLGGVKDAPEVAEANARLIAAAPELLEALELCSFEMGYACWGKPESMTARQDCLAKARAVIAKVKGK